MSGGGTLDREGFRAQFARSSRALWVIAAGMTGDRATAEDIVQDAAVVALGKLDEFTDGTNFTAWMGRIVRHLALNEVRKRGRRRTGTAEPGVLEAVVEGGERPGGAGGPVDSRGGLVDGQREFDDEVLSALLGLDETARSCLLLRVVMDMPYREIALVLDVPEGTAMSHVHRSRKVLRERLGGRGGLGEKGGDGDG